MAYAASRYTEVKLSKICTEVFQDMDKNTIDFVDNYDGSTKEPTLLPTTFPNILANSNQGIAVGMASNICSFNLIELCESTIKLLREPEADISDILKAPDFPTGGELIYNKEEMQEIYRTGRGSIKVRSKYKYDKKNNCIDITEIPYTTTIEAIIEKVVDLVKAGKIKEISDLRDETDLKGLKLTIDLKRGTDPEMLMARLFKMTPLQDSFGCNFNILIEGSPMVLGVNDIICEWLRFRRSCIKRSTAFDIQKKSDKLHLLEGLELILLDIDKAIRIVRETKDDSKVVPNLMTGFGITEIQADFVAEIKLRNLNQDYILKRTAEINQLKAEIIALKEILGSPAKVNKIIEKQLKDVAKKYGKERMTSIVSGDTVIEANFEEVIDDYPVKLFRTAHNYFKKISLVSLRSSGEQRLKDDDSLIQEVEANNTSEILFFASGGDVYKMKAYDIPDGKASQLGEYIPNLVEMTDKEDIVGMISTDDFAGNIIFCFENGKVSKVPLASYATKSNRKKLSGGFATKSPLVKMFYITDDIDLFFTSSNGKGLIVNTDKIPLKATRTTQGVNVLMSKKASTMTDACVLEESKIENLSRFKTKNIPAAGSVIRDSDKGISQIGIFEDI
ncbi:MAG: DNA topoisomerase (ATP-hydrolyzing) subunit A, partial [Oscillospiraceae bacterium]